MYPICIFFGAAISMCYKDVWSGFFDASKLRRRWLGSHQSFLFRNAFRSWAQTPQRHQRHQLCSSPGAVGQGATSNVCTGMGAVPALRKWVWKFLWLWNESRDVLWSLPPCFLIFLSPCLLWPCTTSLFEESLCIFQSIPTSLADASHFF